MIFLRLAGGLGNQLFQLAASTLVAMRSGQKVSVIKSSLQNYNAPRKPESLDLLSCHYLKPVQNGWPVVIAGALANKARLGRWLPLLSLNDRNFCSYSLKKIRSPMFMDGYFQQGWEASDFFSIIPHLLVRKVDSAIERASDAGEVLIHVRGGDFLSLSKFSVVDSEYYSVAVGQASAQGWRKYAILSDDSSYAEQIMLRLQKHHPDLNFRALNTGSSLHDFDVLRAASARIIGNSTFAWWAAAVASQHIPTWSPGRFILDQERSFLLPCELVLQRCSYDLCF